MAATMRSVLSDIFREAIVEGHIENNPLRLHVRQKSW